MLVRAGIACNDERRDGTAVARRDEHVGEQAAAHPLVVDGPRRTDHRFVETNDPSLEVEDAEESRRRIDDVADEIALALELGDVGAKLHLEAIAVERQPRRRDHAGEQLGLVEQRRGRGR